jgi:hypothetical protein
MAIMPRTCPTQAAMTPPTAPPAAEDRPHRVPPTLRRSTVGDLSKFAGTWEGDDIEECIDVVYASRSRVMAG